MTAGPGLGSPGGRDFRPGMCRPQYLCGHGRPPV